MDKPGMRKIVPQIVHIYNDERPHLSLNMLTPNVAHQKSEKLKRRWKNYYQSSSDTEELNLSFPQTNTC
jgi:transposase InsO family protein